MDCRCMDKIMREEPEWGLAFFAHEGINCKDHLLATRTEVAKLVQYDTFITVYISDCDMYPRVMAAGYKLVSYTGYCPGLDLKVRLHIGQCLWNVFAMLANSWIKAPACHQAYSTKMCNSV